MVQKFDYPKSETDFRQIQDKMYSVTKEALANKMKPKFKGLLEIISSEPVILSAIHKIKANRGSMTAGTDGKTIRDILNSSYEEVMERVNQMFKHYEPIPVRRKPIPKPGSNETRKLGIPAIADRIIQECVRSVIEPILEAQFFQHSYGFRPMRDAHMAMERTRYITHKTGYHWVIEGDISKFFDNVNHRLLLNKLKGMGIADQRVLMIIKAMLEAGVMGEIKKNTLGTPQGGIISPILANVYLHSFDSWITREWENKKLKTSHTRNDSRIRALRLSTNLKPAYLIRYADDWIVVTDSKSNAEKLKARIQKYLESNLKLKLSEDKTKITNIRKHPIKFLGFEYKLVKGKAVKGYISRTRPNKQRLKDKVQQIRTKIKGLRRIPRNGKERLVHEVNRINSTIRGVIQYYQSASWVNRDLAKYGDGLRKTSYYVLNDFGGIRKPAKEVNNLLSVHEEYETQIAAIRVNGQWFGITSLDFCKWEKTFVKNQRETPYSPEGRELYRKRTGKKPLKVRADELLSEYLSKAIAFKMTGNNKLYNFEYFLNRAYAFNRDRGKCRICGDPVSSRNVHLHHNKPTLPIHLVNKVQNLSTTHEKCHQYIHDGKSHSELGTKVWKKILDFREKLS